MAISKLHSPVVRNLVPRIVVFGVGGAGCNAINNMIAKELKGAEFVVANTDAQVLDAAQAETRIQLGLTTTQGLGAGSDPRVGAAAAEESVEEISAVLDGSHLCFITAGMGGGTGTGASPVVARLARERDVLTVGVVTKPFLFEGTKRMREAEKGIRELEASVHTLIVVPNENLYMVVKEETTTREAFARADEVLYQGVKGITDLIVQPGLINLDFADVRSIMLEMGNAMMGCGESDADRKDRAQKAAEEAMYNQLLGITTLQDATGILINVIGGDDLTLFDLDVATTTIRQKVDDEANIIVGSSYEPGFEGKVRVSVLATGMGRSNPRGRENGSLIVDESPEDDDDYEGGFIGENTGFGSTVYEPAETVQNQPIYAESEPGQSQYAAADTDVPESESIESRETESRSEFWDEQAFAESTTDHAEQHYQTELSDHQEHQAQAELPQQETVDQPVEFEQPETDVRLRSFVAPRPAAADAEHGGQNDFDTDRNLAISPPDPPQPADKSRSSHRIARFLRRFSDPRNESRPFQPQPTTSQAPIPGRDADDGYDELRSVPAFARRQAN